MNLFERYNAALAGAYGEDAKTDDLPILFDYATECSHITEMGVHWVNTTWVFLYALTCTLSSSLRLVCYDIDYHPRIEEAKREAAQNLVSFTFIQADTATVEIEDTDMLFIDTLHTYKHLTIELTKHSPHVKKYIAIHDTNGKYADWEDYPYDHPVYGTGDPKKYGMIAAVNDFLSQHTEWTVANHYQTWNGLTVLRRA